MGPHVQRRVLENPRMQMDLGKACIVPRKALEDPRMMWTDPHMMLKAPRGTSQAFPGPVSAYPQPCAFPFLLIWLCAWLGFLPSDGWPPGTARSSAPQVLMLEVVAVVLPSPHVEELQCWVATELLLQLLKALLKQRYYKSRCRANLVTREICRRRVRRKFACPLTSLPVDCTHRNSLPTASWSAVFNPRPTSRNP